MNGARAWPVCAIATVLAFGVGGDKPFARAQAPVAHSTANGEWPIERTLAGVAEDVS